MSARNGDKARFQKDRKRKLKGRQRIQEMLRKRRELTPQATAGDNSQGGTP